MVAHCCVKTSAVNFLDPRQRRGRELVSIKGSRESLYTVNVMLSQQSFPFNSVLIGNDFGLDTIFEL